MPDGLLEYICVLFYLVVTHLLDAVTPFRHFRFSFSFLRGQALCTQATEIKLRAVKICVVTIVIDFWYTEVFFTLIINDTS